MRLAGWLLLVGLVVAGCAGPGALARLPTDEERCAFGSGAFHAGLCDYCR
jgi:hypothetical protein